MQLSEARAKSVSLFTYAQPYSDLDEVDREPRLLSFTSFQIENILPNWCCAINLIPLVTIFKIGVYRHDMSSFDFYRLNVISKG